jgi:hypothetical protein
MPRGATCSRVNDELREQIIELGEVGKPTLLIVRKLKLHKSTVHYHLVKAGVKVPVPRQFSFTRRGVEVRSFSSDEDRYIEELSMAGKQTTEIARMVTERFGYRRNANTVGIRLVQIANRDEDQN